MKLITSINDLPNVPSVYAMFGGRGRGLHVAYVGVADKLNRRVIQHLVKRDTNRGMWSLGNEYISPKEWRKMRRGR
jgi:excinuclease UvrABC nuclease subunit